MFTQLVEILVTNYNRNEFSVLKYTSKEPSRSIVLFLSHSILNSCLNQLGLFFIFF